MAIYKANVDSNYTVIPNSTAKDKRLTFEARGMLSLLLSLPSDWQVNNSWLISQSAAGRDKVNSILKELIEFGYMTRQQPKNQHGKFTSNDYFVYASPVDGFAVYGETVDGSAVNGKTPTTKERDIKKKDDTNLDQSKIAREELIQSSFDYWWKAYPTKTARKASFKKWQSITKKMDDKTVTELTNHIVADVAFRLDGLANGDDRFIGFDRLHPSTYLNQERYNDDF